MLRIWPTVICFFSVGWTSGKNWPTVESSVSFPSAIAMPVAVLEKLLVVE